MPGGTNEDLENKETTDPWLAAFAALEQTGKETPEESPAADGNGDNESSDNATGIDNGTDSTETIDSTSNENPVGELDSTAGSDSEEDRSDISNLFGESEVDLEEYRNSTSERVREQAINDIAQEFIKRGFKHNNGVLGITLNDESICKYDEEKVPHFYNPDTGMEFTGENPRRQAQEYVDDYNRELARMFNNACAEYEAHLMKQEAPRLAVMEFKPTYDKLDPIRQGMLDDFIQDFEMKDSDGKLIGYSCDLNKALALVDRQIARIQNYAKQHAQQPKNEPTGPVMDMKTSSGGVPSGSQAAPSTLAEAMERLQDAQLAKLKKN